MGVGNSDEELFEKIAMGKYSPLENVSSSLADLVDRMFKVDPSRRITAQQVLFIINLNDS